MNKLLLLILFILLLIVGKERGAKTFITFLLSMLLIIIYIILMSFGLNALILAFIICILVSLLSLYFLNGKSPKTKSAFIGVMIVLLIMFAVIYIIGKRASIGAYGIESIETIVAFDLGINYNMNNVIIGMYLVSIIGTLIDTSISISSAMNEVYENNPKIDNKKLYKSGMNVGGDILSTTINTLYFALVSTFIGFFMWHKGLSFEEVINYKLLVKDLIQLLALFISSILIIPITSYISSKMLTGSKLFNKYNE
jgi:uncharacterized membrane protein